MDNSRPVAKRVGEGTAAAIAIIQRKRSIVLHLDRT
jgi:hypothetical protein